MHFDAALIDLEGPASADGFARAQAVRKQRPHMKVLPAAELAEARLKARAVLGS